MLLKGSSMTVDVLVAGIITFGSLCTAIVAVGKLINLAGKPNKEQNARISDLENRMVKCESKLLNDNQSMIEQQEKQMEAIDDFIDSKISTTYIVLDPMFSDCPFEREGWYAKFKEAE